MFYYKPPTAKHFDYDGCYTWRRIWAWRPRRTVSGRWIWLQPIFEQQYYTATERQGDSYRMEPFVEYGDIFDVIKEPGDEQQSA